MPSTVNDSAQVQNHECTKKTGEGQAKSSRHPGGKRATPYGMTERVGRQSTGPLLGQRFECHSTSNWGGGGEESEEVSIGRHLGSMGDIPQTKTGNNATI